MWINKPIPKMKVYLILLFMITVSIISGCKSQHNRTIKGAGLYESTDELAERIKVLECIIEGTAHPINLARTSLAKVDASSVNGSRLLNDKCYGIQNVFDDGQHWWGDVNYTSWSPGFEVRPWIEIHFGVPVTITSIFVEQGPSFVTTCYYAKGGQTNFKTAKEQLILDCPVSGVNRVKLSFDKFKDKSPFHVYEVKVLGYPPQGVEFSEGVPDLVVSDPELLGQCEKRARRVFDIWIKQKFMRFNYIPKREETKNAIIFTFGDGNDMDCLRITIDKETHLETIEELVQLVKKEPEVIDPIDPREPIH